MSAIPFGKKLQTSVYLARPASALLASELIETIRRAEAAAKPEPSPSWNLLKLHADQFAISFLSYPDFDNDPHPYLAEATKINLNT